MAEYMTIAQFARAAGKSHTWISSSGYSYRCNCRQRQVGGVDYSAKNSKKTKQIVPQTAFFDIRCGSVLFVS